MPDSDDEKFRLNGGFFEVPCHLYAVLGEKAATFLHGQLTNDIKNLKTGEENYNLFLTQKGKIIADLYVARWNNDFFMMIRPDLVPKVIEHLSKLAPLSRVTLKEITQEWILFHTLPSSSVMPENQNEWKRFPSNRLGINGFDYFIPINQKEIFQQTCQSQKKILLNKDLIKIIRLEKNIPEYGIDFDETNFPQEAHLEQALNFTKGCYLGQEIVARLQYRGHVNKILVQFETKESLNAGDKIYDTPQAEKEIGQVTSSIFSSQQDSYLALGYIPYTANEAGRIFFVGDKKREARIICQIN